MCLDASKSLCGLSARCLRGVVVPLGDGNQIISSSVLVEVIGDLDKSIERCIPFKTTININHSRSKPYPHQWYLKNSRTRLEGTDHILSQSVIASQMKSRNA